MKKSTQIKFLFFALFSLAFSSSQAQKIAPFCGTGGADTEAYSQNPDAVKAREMLEEYTREFIKSAKTKKTTGQKFIIPIVIHIIYSDFQQSTNITDAQVHDAIRILNIDFNKQNSDTSFTIPQFKDLAANVGFEFRLAKTDPNGYCSNGITRTLTNFTNIAGENVKAIVSWPTSKYVNVWVVENIASGAGGYAFKPGSAPLPRNEGIVIRSSQFGSIGKANGDDFSNGSLTHEIGHFFNLDHTFGSSNSPAISTNCDLTDNVEDTPPTIGGPQGSLSCNLASLTKKKFGALTYSCPDTNGLLPNYQNYMDYTGACYTMFTEGQKARMHAAINASIGNRSNLWSEGNLKATGIHDDNYFTITCPPRGAFYSDEQTVCAGDTVQFIYLAQQDSGSTFKWLFPGGTISPKSSETSKNPRVGYSAAGSYDVKLVSTNAAGTDTLTYKNFIRVNSELAWYGAANFSEDFETANITDRWTVVNLEKDNVTWSLTNSAFFKGKTSVKINNFHSNGESGLTDYLISPPLSFALTESGTMTFKAALAKTIDRTGLETVLRIAVSSDCGKSWSNIKTYSIEDLLTGGYVNGVFTPNSENLWKEHTVTLASNVVKKKEKVLIRFEFLSSFVANNLYIDDINFPFNNTGIENLAANLNLSVYPNPSEGSSLIKFSLVKSDKVSMKVYDVLGKEISGLSEVQNLNAGEHQLPVTVKNKGIYIVKLSVGENTYTKKLIIN